MNKRYQLIIQDNDDKNRDSQDDISILLVDNVNFMTILDTKCMKEYQQDIEDMALLKYGDNLNIIKHQYCTVNKAT